MKNIPQVAIVRRTDSVEATVRQALHLIGGLPNHLNKNSTILIKPNFIRPEPSSVGTTTSLDFIEATVNIFRETGAEIIVGEASGNQYNTEEIFDFVGLPQRLPGVKILDLDKTEIVSCKIPKAKSLLEVGVSRLALEADFIVSLPVLKTHNATIMTGGMKNMMGTLPQREKWKMHLSGLHQALADLNKLVKPDLVIMDALICQEGLGPTMGRPVKMDLVLTSYDAVAIDAVGTAIMGFDPKEIKHIQLAARDGQGIGEIKKIEVVGERITDVVRQFRPPFALWFFIFIGIWQYRIGNLLLKHFNYDIRTFLRNFAGFHLPKPQLIKSYCTSSGYCVEICPNGAITLGTYPHINYDLCNGCMRCFEKCPNKSYKLARKPRWVMKIFYR